MEDLLTSGLRVANLISECSETDCRPGSCRSTAVQLRSTAGQAAAGPLQCSCRSTAGQAAAGPLQARQLQVHCSAAAGPLQASSCRSTAVQLSCQHSWSADNSIGSNTLSCDDSRPRERVELSVQTSASHQRYRPVTSVAFSRNQNQR